MKRAGILLGRQWKSLDPIPGFLGTNGRVHEKCLVDKCLFLKCGSLPNYLSYSSLTWVLFSHGVLAHRTLPICQKDPWMPPSVIVTPLFCAESCSTTATLSGICAVLLPGLQQIWLCQCCSALSHLSHGYIEVISNQLFKLVFHSVFPKQEHTNLEKYKPYCLGKAWLPFCLNCWHSCSANIDVFRKAACNVSDARKDQSSLSSLVSSICPVKAACAGNKIAG